jgi:type I restriction enzyme S subunit
MRQVAVRVPTDIKEQKRIADTLSTFDDKIEMNAKINHHLEQMAQAIFKSWFVDFEPFANGGFIDSELGEIPAGWRVGTLSELITVKYGKDHKKLADGSIPVFGSGGIMRFADTALYRSESVLIPRKGTLSNVIYVNQPFWSVDTMFFTEMNRPNLAKFVYFFVLSKDLASMNAGSAVPSMTTEILNALPVVIPPTEELARFEDAVGIQFAQIEDNMRENDTLATLRDTLLPRLMSGELYVADINTDIDNA